jgi:uncharacterized protein (DUF111 family)
MTALLTIPVVPPASYDDLSWAQKLAILRRWRDQHEDIESIAKEEGIPNLEDDLRKEYGRRCPAAKNNRFDWTPAEIETLRAIYLMPFEKQEVMCSRKLKGRTYEACKRQATTLGITVWSADDVATLRRMIEDIPFDKLRAAVAAAFPTRAEMVAWRKALALRRP